jgi:hypothetical protein
VADEPHPAPEATTQNRLSPLEQEELEQFVFIGQALAAATQEEQHQVVAAALLRFGYRFISMLQGRDRPAFKQLRELSDEQFRLWLAGVNLSHREDERERRATAALEVLQSEDRYRFAVLAAEALLNLPEGHPKRDLTMIRPVLEAALAADQHVGAWDRVFHTAATLVRSNTMSETETGVLIEELRRAAAVAREAGADIGTSGRARFFRSASSHYLARAVGAREKGSTAESLLVVA